MTRDPEGGFTLVELLIAVVLLGIFVGTLTEAMIAFLHNAESSGRRTDNAAQTALLSNYLDRDLSSATSVTTSGTACSGVSNTVAFSWREWTATPSPNPSPTPGTTYTAAYATVVDPAPYPGNPTRYLLKRWYCQAGTVLSTNSLVPDLLTASDFGVVTAPTPAPTPCPTGSPVILQLKQFEQDAPSTSYRFAGCLAGRGQL